MRSLCIFGASSSATVDPTHCDQVDSFTFSPRYLKELVTKANPEAHRKVQFRKVAFYFTSISDTQCHHSTRVAPSLKHLPSLTHVSLTPAYLIQNQRFQLLWSSVIDLLLNNPIRKGIAIVEQTNDSPNAESWF